MDHNFSCTRNDQLISTTEKHHFAGKRQYYTEGLRALERGQDLPKVNVSFESAGLEQIVYVWYSFPPQKVWRQGLTGIRKMQSLLESTQLLCWIKKTRGRKRSVADSTSLVHIRTNTNTYIHAVSSSSRVPPRPGCCTTAETQAEQSSCCGPL